MREIMDSFRDILFKHLDHEVESLRGEEMKKVWFLWDEADLIVLEIGGVEKDTYVIDNIELCDYEFDGDRSHASITQTSNHIPDLTTFQTKRCPKSQNWTDDNLGNVNDTEGHANSTIFGRRSDQSNALIPWQIDLSGSANLILTRSSPKGRYPVELDRNYDSMHWVRFRFEFYFQS